MTTEVYHQICHYLCQLALNTQWWGHLYAVGGCCRDEAMGLPIKDIDLAVDLPNGGIRFADWLHQRNLLVDEPVRFHRFGTARLSLREFPDQEIELVQTRREKYTDRNSRCPETAFGTIEEDCMRRDLTINSLYYDICRRQTVDITGTGLSDIRRCVIRTPADPDTTYDDDPVRIYRTLRFAARFGWEIEPSTLQGLMRNIPRLSIVTPTRCHTELEHILSGPNHIRALEMLADTGALQYMLPEVAAQRSQPTSSKNQTTVWQQTLATLRHLPDDAPLELRLAALFCNIGKPSTALKDSKGHWHFPNHDQTGSGLTRRIMRRLRFERKVIDQVDFLVRHQLWTTRWGAQAERMKDHHLRKLQYVCAGRKRFTLLITLIDAICHRRGPEWANHTATILTRTQQMIDGGSAMFKYTIPIPPSAIKRLKHTDSLKEVKRCRDYLLKMAFIDPRRKPDHFTQLLIDFK